MLQPLCKTAWQFLIKPNILIPYDPAITLPDILPNELKTYVHAKIYTQMLTTAKLGHEDGCQ
jgi:hypothetical protein